MDNPRKIWQHLLGHIPEAASLCLSERIVGFSLVNLHSNLCWHSPSLWKFCGHEGPEFPEDWHQENLLWSSLPDFSAEISTVMLRHSSGSLINGSFTRFPAQFKHLSLHLLVFTCAPASLSREDAEQLALVVSKTSNAIIITDAHGCTEWINGGCNQIYGYSLEEMQGKKPGELLQGAETSLLTSKRMSEALAKGEVVNEIILNYHKNGEKRWIDLNITPVLNETGKVVRFISVGRNITLQKEAEHKLQEQEAMLRALASNFPNGSISLLDQHLNFIFTGGNGYSRFGADPQQYIGKNMCETHPPEVVKVVEVHLPMVLNGESISHETSFGGRIYHNTYSPIKNEEGEVEEFVLAVTDISERKQMEETLLRQKGLLNQAEAITHAGSWELDLANQKLFWSDEVFRICGYEPQSFEVTFERGLEVIHKDDQERALAAFQETIQTGKPYTIEKRFVRKDGSLRDILSTGKLITDEAGKPLTLFGVFQDITESKVANEELRRVKEMLDQTNKAARVGGWEYHPDSGKLLWSRITHRIHEVPKNYQPTLAKALKFFKGTENRALLDKAWKHAFKTGEGYDLELKLTTHKGNTLWVRTIGQAEIADGKVVRLFGAIYDIDQQKQTELALSEANEAYKTLIGTIEGIVWESVPATEQVTYISPRAESMLGYPLHRWYNQPGFWESILHEDDREIAIAYSQKHFSLNQPYQHEYRIRKADGGVIWVRDMVNVVVEKGATKKFRGIIIDITEQKKQVNQLRLLESVVTHTKDAVLITDAGDNPSGKQLIVYANEAFSQMTGYTPEEVIGKSPKFLQGPNTNSRVLKTLGEAIGRWESIEVELLNYRKNGEEFWVNFAITPVANDKGWFTHWVAIERDITEKRKAEALLIQSKEAAESANKAKSEFLANMSHEIRTPLNGVIGYSDLLKSTPLDYSQEEYVQAIGSSARVLLEMVNDILDFSKIEAGKMELSLESTDLRLICSQALDIVRYPAEDKGLRLHLHISPEVPHFVRTDGVRLRQVLVNLLSNAVKFTAQGAVDLRVTNTGKSSKGKFLLRFEVQDTGIGIDPDNQTKIFSAFVQEDSSTTRKFGGTGLGLSISNKLLDLMGSEIQLKSTPGQGSTFWFDLHLADGVASQVDEGTYSKISKTPSGEGIRLLIVEDNPINMRLARSIVRALMPQVEIREAENGYQALEIIKSEPIHLVMLDIQMPGINGYDTAKAIRKMEKSRQRIPIVAVTAGTLKGERAKCLAAGMDDYMTKPIDKAVVGDMLHRWAIKSSMDPQLIENAEALHFDSEQLLERLNAQHDIIRELLEMVPQVMDSTLKEMQKALKEKNLGQLKLLAHRTKGNALNMSFHRLAQLAQKFHSIKRFDPKPLQEMVEEVAQEMEAVKDSVKKYL
jgi:PAS domain S-box-containing protein